jgi:hypothetical protein
VRKLLGYERYDTPEAVAAINAVYADLRLLQNLFLPSVKLRRKVRVGAKVRRDYDTPLTPLDRVRACPTADPVKVEALVALQRDLDPFELRVRIDAGLERVFALAHRRSSARRAPGGREDCPVLPERQAAPPPAPNPVVSRPGPRVRAGHKPSLTDGRAA